MLGFLFFMLFIAGFAFVMLQERQLTTAGIAGGGSGITGTSWRPTFVGEKQLSTDSGLFLEIDVDGSIRGHGGCNALFATLVTEGAGVAVRNIGATRMACEDAVMQRESAYLDALADTRKIQSSPDTLYFLDERGQVLVQFVEAADERASGTD